MISADFFGKYGLRFLGRRFAVCYILASVGQDLWPASSNPTPRDVLSALEIF